MLVLEYKIKAKKHQYSAIEEAIKTTQFVRNKCLRYWMDAPREAKLNGYSLNKYSTELRNEFKFVADLNSMAVQASAERAWLSISRFYDNCKKKVAGKKGYPRFQHDNRSVEYKTSGWKLNPVKRRITITDKKGIGELKLLGKWDIQTYDVKSIKRVRLVRRADGYYCQFCIGVDASDPQPLVGNEIGLDVGLESFYTDSNGHQETNPRFFRKAEKSVKQAQRRIYKKVKKSSGRKKARGIFARKHLRISRQRTEHAKRLARHVVKSNDLIAYVRRSRCRRLDLKVRNLLKNHCLAKSISDVSWSIFRQWIDYFAGKFGRLAIAVPPHYSSQKCSSCGVIVKKSLSTRTHVCSCGCSLHRDENAAINILNLVSDTLRDGKQARDGQSRSNANGLVASTLLGESLIEQVTR
ncbi:MAG: RNA-guided endonuclease InsQ/TnpB family protein [Gloeotrichia echinulata GP01]